MRTIRLGAAFAATFSLLAGPVYGQAAATPAPIEVGAAAPDFEIGGATKQGVMDRPIKLTDYRGKVVVLAFFPRARTRGCTIQMHAYRDQYAELFNGGEDVVLLAVSADAATELASWAKDADFPFMMGSDIGLDVANKYGAVGRPGETTNRNLFVIGKDGKIAHRMTPFREIDATSYTELAEVIDRLATDASGTGY
jgi:peroxiredoxin Q/BCP